jgi:hypothetical protein
MTPTHATVLGQIADIYERLGMKPEALAAQEQRVAVLQAHGSREVNAWIEAQWGLAVALDASAEVSARESATRWLVGANESAQSPAASPERRSLALAYLADHHRSAAGPRPLVCRCCLGNGAQHLGGPQ